MGKNRKLCVMSVGATQDAPYAPIGQVGYECIIPPQTSQCSLPGARIKVKSIPAPQVQ